ASLTPRPMTCWDGRIASRLWCQRTCKIFHTHRILLSSLRHAPICEGMRTLSTRVRKGLKGRAAADPESTMKPRSHLPNHPDSWLAGCLAHRYLPPPQVPSDGRKTRPLAGGPLHLI